MLHRAAESELKGASNFVAIPISYPQQIVEEVEDKVVLDMTEAKFGCNHLVPTLIHIDGGQQGVIKVEHLVIGSPFTRRQKALEDKAASLTLQIGQISPGIHRLIRVTIVEQISQCTIQPMFVNQGRGRHMKR